MRHGFALSSLNRADDRAIARAAPARDWAAFDRHLLLGHATDIDGDGKSDLLHLWNGGANTLLANGDGTSRLVAEGCKPRADYNMDVGFDIYGPQGQHPVA